MVKRVVIILGYWMIAVLLITVILTSFDLSFIYALMYGLVFVPAALIAKIIIPDSSPYKDPLGIKNIVFISLGLLFLCFALVFSVSLIIKTVEGNYMVRDLGTPSTLTNPVFLAAMVMLLLAGDYFTGVFVDKHFPIEDRQVDFISNRKQIKLKRSEITCIESNDTEVWIHTASGDKFRNKTPIGQWENRLGKGFVRISRSYLVNEGHITESGPGFINLGGIRLACSKKYVSDSSCGLGARN